jgi:hypothetical protein
MEHDEAKLELVRKLAKAIQGTLAKSDEIAKTVFEIRANGLDVKLSLNGTISVSSCPVGAINAKGHGFLSSMHIAVDFESDVASE